MPVANPRGGGSTQLSRAPTSKRSSHRAEGRFGTWLTKPKLLSTWSRISKELHKVAVRDCIDHLDSQSSVNQWMPRLWKSLSSGVYYPQSPSRVEESKNGGAFRVITVPALHDILAYRHIADAVYRSAKRDEPANAFFSRRHTKEAIGDKIDSISDDEYQIFFQVWLRYNQYRKKLLLNGLEQIAVVTDITNYFDSIQHSLLFEQLSQYGMPREVTGILGKLLDALRPRAGHSPTPHVGLPVDFFDCSRQLAHIFLFDHDRRMIKHGGPKNYVRWMDDQNILTVSETDARHTVRCLVQSLNELRLTLNAGKTKFLSPAEVEQTFHLQLNQDIDTAEENLNAGATFNDLADELIRIKTKISECREGHWDKIVKRLYALASRMENDAFTLSECYADIVAAPQLAERIFDYLASRSRWNDFCSTIQRLRKNGESIYEDVEAHWFETILRWAPPKSSRSGLCSLAMDVLSRQKGLLSSGRMKSLASLVIYWVGNNRSRKSLQSLLSQQAGSHDADLQRTLTAICCATGTDPHGWLLKGARLPAPQIATLVDFADRILVGGNLNLPGYLATFRMRRGVRIYDARTWLRLELLSRTSNAKVRKRLKATLNEIKNHPMNDLGQAIADRIDKRISHSAGQP